MATRDFLFDRMEHFLRTRLSDQAHVRVGHFRPALTISRECGAGMDKVGCALVDYLSDVDDSTEFGWAIFDQGMIGKVIENHQLPEIELPFISENAKFPASDVLGQTLSLEPSDWTLFNYFADVIRYLCAMGNAIVVGRAGNFVTVDLGNTFHVRIVGSLVKRIQYTADRYGISLENAADLVRETDKCRRDFVDRYTKVEFESPAYYHLVINTDDYSADTVARVIGDSLLEWACRKNRMHEYSS